MHDSTLLARKAPAGVSKRSGVRRITEADVTRQIRDVLKLARVFHWKSWQGPMSQPKGVADILGIFEGKFLAIEVKRPGGKLRPDQVKFLARINAEGGIAFKAESVEEVVNALGLKANVAPLFYQGGAA